MSAGFQTLFAVACGVCVIAGCSQPGPRANLRPVPAYQNTKPSPPRRGEPINIIEFVRYFESESTNLLYQGRIATNLLQQPRPAACSLTLAPAPSRVLPGDELPLAIETGVAVVGRLANVGGKPQLTPTASGFFLTESGALATCWHVLDWDKLIGLTVMTRDGRVCPVRQVLAVNPNYDLAILQVEGSGFTPLPVVPKVAQGAPVWVLGHPFPWYYMLTTGIAAGYYTLTDATQNLTILDITAEFANGSSGAPVLNEYGAVVAIAKFRQSIGLPGTPQMNIKGCLPAWLLLEMTKLPSSP